MSMLPRYRLRGTEKEKYPSVPTTTPDFASCLHTFSSRDDSPASPASPASVDHPIFAVAAPSPPVEVIDPATSERKGSITHDRKRRSPTHEWNSLDEFKTWRMKEQLDHGIELLLVRTLSAGSSLWHERRIYVCSRQGTGGKYKYVKKHPERIRSRPSKQTGCRCGVIVKTYLHTSTVLGWYRAEHDHATGIPNLRFTRLQDSTRAYASSLLRRHMEPKEVLMRVRSEHGEHERGHYITRNDIYRIRKTIKQEDLMTQPISSHRPSYERSKDSPAEVEELLFPEDVSAGSSQMDEKPEVSDEQSNGCGDPGTPMSPTSEPASQASTPGVTAIAESTSISVDGRTYHHLPGHLATQAVALPPLPILPKRGRHPGHQIPVSAPPLTFAPVINSAIYSAPAPTPAVVPASQVAHNITPFAPSPHVASVPYHTSGSVPYYTPQPLVVYVPHPPYQMTQMTLYPIYPPHYPPPNI